MLIKSSLFLLFASLHTYIIFYRLKQLYLYKKYYNVEYKSFYGITFFSNLNTDDNIYYWNHKIMGTINLYNMMILSYLYSK